MTEAPGEATKARIAELEKQVQILSKTVEARDATIEARDATIEARDATIKDLNAKLERAVLLSNVVYFAGCGSRFKKRERQLLCLLAWQSFGQWRLDGVMDLDWLWARLEPCGWRYKELSRMAIEWRRAGWLAVDADVFRIVPDCLPGWADCFLGVEPGESGRDSLGLSTEAHVASVRAELSQERASKAIPDGAKFSHTPACEIFAPSGIAFDAKISQAGVCENFARPTYTFNRTDVSTLKRNVAVCENFARGGVAAKVTSKEDWERAEKLKLAVRGYVGDQDWLDQRFWDGGKKLWVARLFVERHDLVLGCLNFVSEGERTGEAPIIKTRGAALWSEIQGQLRKAKA